MSSAELVDTEDVAAAALLAYLHAELASNWFVSRLSWCVWMASRGLVKGMLPH